MAILTTSEAVQRLISLGNDSGFAHKQLLLTTLEAALASILRGSSTPAVNQLHASQTKVGIWVSSENPTLALDLIELSSQIVDALNGDGCALTEGKIQSIKRTASGRTLLKARGTPGNLYILGASANLRDWQAISVLRPDLDGDCSSEHADALDSQSRFYRIRQLG